MWHPRGENRSANCPQCGSDSVELEIEGCLRALRALIVLPFVLLLIFIRSLVRLFKRWIGSGATGSTKPNGSGAHELAQGSSPANDPLMELESRLSKESWHALGFAARWVASVKDDLRGGAAREVNPVSMVSKLLVFTAACSVSIIVLINLVLLVTWPWRRA
jgi:hypothetical protein